jgi:tetratricopeptide (TPR) repeat protein
VIWGNVPQRNKNFIGRSELLVDLGNRLTGEATALLPHAIHGLGGVGKTQLAIEYAYQHAAEYQVVWWIPADQNALVRSNLAALAPRLGITGLVPGRVEDALAAVLDALRRGDPYDRWLLVFDNADEPARVRNMMPTGQSHGHIIVTSRNQAWAQVVDTLEVNVFTRAESTQFLTSRVDGISDTDADRLAEEFGDLPLGLEQAAAWLAETAMTADTYVDLIEKEGSRILAEDSASSDYPLPVAAAWALSVTRLREQTPYAMELLQCCAFFGAAPIQLEILDRGRYVLTSGLEETLRDPIMMGRAIRALGRYALARVDNYRHTIEVHRIIQLLIRDEMDEDKRYNLRHDVHLLLAAADPGDPDAIENWPKYQELLAHVAPSEVVTCRTADARRLAQNIVRYLYITGNYSSGLSSADRALARWTTDSGADELFVLIMTRLKIQLLQALARYQEAYELTLSALERMRAKLGEDHEETLILMNCHCISLRARGEFSASLEFTRDSLERHLSVFGSEHPRTFAAMHNYAEDLELNGQYSAARKRHEEIYEEKLVVYGRDDHPRVLFTLGALARTVEEEGHYRHARDVAERAHAGFRELVRERILADGHPWVLGQTVDLSIARRQAGTFSNALELAKDVHGRYRRSFYGPDHPGALAAAANLGNSRIAVGDLQGADELLDDTLRRYSSVFSSDHPYALACAVNLSIVRRRLGNASAARAALERATEKFREQLGSDHHYTLIGRLNLANVLADLGEAAEAVHLGEDTLPRLKTTLGHEHPHVLICAANLALYSTYVGDQVLASELVGDVAERLRNVIGDDHPDVKAAVSRKLVDVCIDLSATF